MVERAVMDRAQKWIDQIDLDAQPEVVREQLASLAYALQFTLSHGKITRAVIPHAPALEVLMRAVLHDIEGDPEKKKYIRGKLETGYGYLMNLLSD
jgi:hypothetical protein